MNQADVELAKKWAEVYTQRGLKVLPSRPDAKRPMLHFSEFWEAPLPGDLFTSRRTTNLQIMTGRRQTTAEWGLIVIDLDGPEAPGVLSTWGLLPRSWVSRSGQSGSHIWLRVPKEGPPLPKGFLWRGEGKHSGIERLGDRALVMAPPSIHPKTGNRYRWLPGQSPREVPLPAWAPRWLLARPLVDLGNAPARRGPSYREVLDRLPHKVELARQWGLRLAASRPNAGGWIYCHAIDREDRTPSAALNIDTGRYVDFGTGARLSFIDLGIALGRFRDVREALQHLKGI